MNKLDNQSTQYNNYKSQVANIIAAELATLRQAEDKQWAVNKALSSAIKYATKSKTLPPSPLAFLTRKDDDLSKVYQAVNGSAFLGMAHAFVDPNSTVRHLDNMAYSLASGEPVEEPNLEEVAVSDENTVPVTLAAAELLAVDPTQQLSTEQADQLTQVIEKAYSCALHKGYLGGCLKGRPHRVFRRVTKLSGDLSSVINGIADCVSVALDALGITDKSSQQVDQVAQLTEGSWESWLSTMSDTDLDKAISDTEAVANTLGLSTDTEVNQDIQDAQFQQWIQQQIEAKTLATSQAEDLANNEASRLVKLRWINFIIGLPTNVIKLMETIQPDKTTSKTIAQSFSAAALAMATDPATAVTPNWQSLLAKLAAAPSDAVASFLTSNNPEL